MRGILWISIALVSVAAHSAPVELGETVSAVCNRQSQAPLYTSDFHWGYSLPDMLQRFAEVYNLPKRLGRHAYFDSQSGEIRLPYDADHGGDAVVPVSFVASIRAHIENALRLEYVDAVFFPDMGHSHFFIPQKKWDSEYSGIPTDKMARLYERMMADPELKILYHTAEQLAFLDGQRHVVNDRRMQERFYSRNLVGDNRGEGRLEFLQNRDQPANAASEMAGYFYWGAGFNVSSNKDGCFVYNDRGVERYFDLSLYDLETDPNQPDDGR
jgi:hypothetical protein